MDLEQSNLANKVILEVGSGRGGTTREIVQLLKGQSGARLIVTDISDVHFGRLSNELSGAGVRIDFVCTDACILEGIDDESIDAIVCNYTLCAIDAQPGRAVLALRRFFQVLRPRGHLHGEEEFPIDRTVNPRQAVWAEKWRLLKAATMLTGDQPYTEFAPETLAELCRLVGFEQVAWTADTAQYGPEAMSFLRRRAERLLPRFLNKALRTGFEQWVSAIEEQANQAGGMQVPFYRMTAGKPGL